MASSLQDLINQKVAQQGFSTAPLTKPKNSVAEFRLVKVSNGHILEMHSQNGKIVRIIPDGEDIGAHVTTALVEAKLEG